MGFENNANKMLGIESEKGQVIDVVPEQVIDVPAVVEVEVEDDYQYARSNIKTAIDVAKDAIEELGTVASASESPRAYEVLSGLLNNLVTANKELLAIKKTSMEIREPNDHKTINNNLIMSTVDLQKFLEGK